MKEFLDLFLHLDEHLKNLTSTYGVWVHAIVFLIIFCETGLVIMPFLPGDSLLFAMGALCADPQTGLNVWVSAAVMLVAAIARDSVNYWIGRYAGQWLVNRFPKIVKQEHIDKTHSFFDRYGGKTLIIARFVPIVRTFAPFVAGTGQMCYRQFMTYNVIGALLWVGLLLPAGYLFGGMEFVKHNFEMVVFAIIGISLLPMVVTVIREKLKKSEEK